MKTTTNITDYSKMVEVIPFEGRSSIRVTRRKELSFDPSSAWQPTEIGFPSYGELSIAQAKEFMAALQVAIDEAEKM